MKVYCYQKDQSEKGMIFPVLNRLGTERMLCFDWRDADIILIPGDRREAVRFAIDVFEQGKVIWHLGAGDTVDDPYIHYDHAYRQMISMMAAQSGGERLALHSMAVGVDHVVGPTMIDDIPKDLERPFSEPYNLLLWNWAREETLPELPGDKTLIRVAPGNDGNIKEAMPGYDLGRLERTMFLCWLKHADAVYGNSSALCYEAPLFHDNENIHLIGKRNAGRRIVRWEGSSPSGNVVNLLKVMDTRSQSAYAHTCQSVKLR